MLNGLSFLIEYIWYIFGFIILSIPFYIWFYKYVKPDVDFSKSEEVNKKNLYLNRIDIIENKVFIIIGLFIALIIGAIRLL
jgi:hypothetical protein